MPSEDDYIKSLRKDFFEEAFDMLERMESSILILEDEKSDEDSLSEIFRAVHTLKGSAGAVELDEISKYAHRFEDLLDALREKKFEVDNEVVDVLLNGIDILKELINTSYEEEEIERDIDSDVKEIEEFKEKKLSGGADSKNVPAEAPKEEKTEKAKEESGLEIVKQTPELQSDKVEEINEYVDDGMKPYLVHVTFQADSPMRTVGGVQVFVALKEAGNVVTSIPSLDELETDNFYQNVTYLLMSGNEREEIQNSIDLPDVISEHLVEEFDLSNLNLLGSGSDKSEKSAAHEEQEEEKPETKKEESKKEKPEESKKEEKTDKKAQAAGKDMKRQSSFLRVESERIDDMLNQVGELVINKGAYQRYDEEFAEFIEKLNFSMSEMKSFVKQNVVDILKKAENPIPKKESKAIKNSMMEELNSLYKNVNNSIFQFREIVDKYRSSYQILTRTTNELQETVMNIRMVPIAQIFNRFPRLVRDLSRELNKKMELEITGEDTELDKTVIEVLVDPLVHIVRNSIDHGIEMPEDREANGKDPVGKIHLSAAHEGNLIIIKIIDDGKGINVEKVRQKAIKAGLIDDDSKVTKKQILDTIFEPGLSTADKISNISGRGVGMDVVKRSIEKINGTISVETEEGIGSIITLRIPLTLAIIQALVVTAEEEYYSIPLNSITETMRLEKKDIINLEGVPVIQLRNEVVTVVFLKEIFSLPEKGEDSAMYAVIISFEDKRVAVIVDGLVGEQDIVIKPLKDRISNTKGVAGATILPDGTISFILDVQTLVDLGAQRIMESREQKGYYNKGESKIAKELQRAKEYKEGKAKEENFQKSGSSEEYAREAINAARQANNLKTGNNQSNQSEEK